MKNSLHKILIWVIGFVIIGMMTSCEDILTNCLSIRISWM